MSWAVPANRGEALFLWPSLHHCAQRLRWLPNWVVGDRAYISLASQRRIREELQVAVVTRLRSDMRWIEPYDSDGIPRCPQGQPLEWLGYDSASQDQWFGATQKNQLCNWCWQQVHCPREFAYPASAHEILFGLLPQATPLAKHLLEKVRPWVEANLDPPLLWETSRQNNSPFPGTEILFIFPFSLLSPREHSTNFVTPSGGTK